MTGTEKSPGAEARKEQILDAAIEAFGEKNYNWASTKEIAEKAGLSERMVFFYFNNKKELFLTAYKKAGGALLKAVMHGRPPIDDIRTFIKMVSRNMVTFFEEEPSKIKILLKAVANDADPDIKKEARKSLDTLFETFSSVIDSAKEKGLVPEDLRTDTTTIFIIGFGFVAAHDVIFDLGWFTGEHEDALAIGDYYIDTITRRK